MYIIRTTLNYRCLWRLHTSNYIKLLIFIQVPLQGTSMQQETIIRIKPAQWLPTYGCLFMFYPFKCCASSKEAARTTFNVFVITRQGFKPPTSRTRSKHSNHFATESGCKWPRYPGISLALFRLFQCISHISLFYSL